MNDLPTINGNDGLTDTTVLEELSQIKECLIVLGASGSGKTRTLIELLCKKYGFYFTGLTKDDLGSCDLSMMIEHLLSRLKNPLIHNGFYTMRYSKCLLFAQIYTLNLYIEKLRKNKSIQLGYLAALSDSFFWYRYF
ncbi:unnamed protein product [Rhizophagus irregularis]|uniref:Uncharacterized protein n=1 Tax=Rhizophagus irregularis TaxID=588596 RepID=A0A915Z315_9GLOM|nr:unnamed protein product [Rhizophagus irregularis]CAB5358966.1 unnamed protein product [Rhizophagus irregularis]